MGILVLFTAWHIAGALNFLVERTHNVDMGLNFQGIVYFPVPLLAPQALGFTRRREVGQNGAHFGLVGLWRIWRIGRSCPL